MEREIFIFIRNSGWLLRLTIAILFLRQKGLVFRLIYRTPTLINFSVLTLSDCIILVLGMYSSWNVWSSFGATIIGFRKKLTNLGSFLLKSISDQLLNYLKLVNPLSLYSELFLFLTDSLQILSLIYNWLFETTLCSWLLFLLHLNDAISDLFNLKSLIFFPFFSISGLFFFYFNSRHLTLSLQFF